MSTSFPRGEVIYTLNPDALEATGVFTGDVLDNGKSKTFTEFAKSRAIMGEKRWREELERFLRNCPMTARFDQKNFVISLSSSWLIGIKSQLNCTFDGKEWTMHPDVRFGWNLSIVQEMMILVSYPLASFNWQTAVWIEDPTHHVVRGETYSYKFYGRDPKILMGMIIAVFQNYAKPAGLKTDEGVKADKPIEVIKDGGKTDGNWFMRLLARLWQNA